MDNYNLEPGEFVILQESSVTLYENSAETKLDELLLTNRSLILVNTASRGLFQHTRYLKRCPLEEISHPNDVPQVMAVKFRNDYRLQAVFRDETVVLRFPANPKRGAERWTDAILSVSQGNYSDVQTGDYLPPEITNLVDGAKDAFGCLFAGGKDRAARTAPKSRPTSTTRKCVGCHAPLTGRAGTTATCPYCDTKQTL